MRPEFNPSPSATLRLPAARGAVLCRIAILRWRLRVAPRKADS